MTEQILLPWPRDELRYRLHTRESNQHQAKMEIRTYLWCVMRYSQPGDTIMDPMSGVGTLHLANYFGRHTVGIELVQDFVSIQHANIQRTAELYQADKLYGVIPPDDWSIIQPNGMEEIGLNQTIRGDCRAELPLDKPVHAVIFSPPYGDLWSYNSTSRDSTIAKEKNYVVGYDDSVANVGNYNNYTQYLTAMGIIYKKCLEALKPGGVLVTIVKDYIKGGKRIYCSRDNLRKCLEAGFEMHEWHLRDTSIQNNPFSARNKANRIAKGTHNPELEIKAEDILVVRRPE